MLRFFTALMLMLVIALPSVVSAEEEYWEYTFRPGDSIWDIASKYTTTVNNWVEIQKINEIRQGKDRKIRPGTRIVIPVSMLKQQPTPALVVALTGDASLVRANGDKLKLTVGEKLYSGDRIITLDKQSLSIQFADKSELQVYANSEVVLDKLSQHKKTGMVDTRIRLNTGSINTRVEKQQPDSHYEIRTPAAITAVRGTEFRLTTNEKFSRTEVTEGLVAVTAGETERVLQDGYGIVAEVDKPLPEPVKLLPGPEVSIKLSSDKTTVTMSWLELDGAKFYRYQLSNDEKFNQIIIDSKSTDNSITMNQLEPGNYYFRVRGIDQIELEGLDSISNFEIYEPPPPVENTTYWPTMVAIWILLISIF
jgi:hypothetical protein